MDFKNQKNILTRTKTPIFALSAIRGELWREREREGGRDRQRKWEREIETDREREREKEREKEWEQQIINQIEIDTTCSWSETSK